MGVLKRVSIHGEAMNLEKLGAAELPANHLLEEGLASLFSSDPLRSALGTVSGDRSIDQGRPLFP
jgi:hypothetical protein